VSWQDTQQLMTRHLNSEVFKDDPLECNEGQYNTVDVSNKSYCIELKNRERYTAQDFNGSFIEKIKYDALIEKSKTENKTAGYIVRFADGKYYAWNLNKISEITDYIKWRQQLLPRNTHFGDNTLIKKEVGDLFLNEAVLLYEETKQKEQSNA